MIIIYSLLTLFWLLALIDGLIGMSKIKPLPQEQNDENPFISVIVAAKDEETSIAQTIQSLTKQRGVQLEIIAVNDRSTDDTGNILNRLKSECDHVTVHHIHQLPEGWLGKNHALQKGYEVSKGNYIVFTDADVLYEPNALKNAYLYLQKEQVDHVTIAPNLQATSVWLKSFVSYFLFGFGFFKRPWTANNDHSLKGGMGIGAFQLMPRNVYEEIGTHKAFPLRPDDDLYLGQRIKASGFKQRLTTGFQQISVEWYPNLKEGIKGLEKNTFAGLNYSYLMGLFAITGTFFSQVLPFFLIWATEGLLQQIVFVNILLMLALFIVTIRKMTTYSIWFVFMLPLSASLFIYAITKALLLTFIQGGIKWRGTFYPLDELKKKN